MYLIKCIIPAVSFFSLNRNTFGFNEKSFVETERFGINRISVSTKNIRFVRKSIPYKLCEQINSMTVVS